MTQIITIAIVCYWLAELTMIPQRFAKAFTGKYSLKPFTCALCLAFWSSTITNILNSNGLNIQELFRILTVAALTSAIAVFIKSIHDRINR